MAPHSSTLAWKIPWTEEPGRLQSMGSLRVGHDWATSLSCIGEGNGNPLQCSCLENPRDGGAWWAVFFGSHRVGHDWSDLAAAAAAAGRNKIHTHTHTPAHAQAHTLKRDNPSAFIINPNLYFHLRLVSPDNLCSHKDCLNICQFYTVPSLLLSTYDVPASWNIFPHFTYKKTFHQD